MTDAALKRMQQLYSGGPYSRFGTQYLFDAVSWVAAIVLAAFLRFEFDVSRMTWVPLLVLCLGAAVVQLLSGWIFFLYRGRHPYGSFAEVQALVLALLLTTIVVGVPVLLFGTSWSIPRSIIAIALPIAFVLMGGFRYLKRFLLERTLRPDETAAPTLVFGAGYLGSTIVRRMRTDRLSAFYPVGLIDDDPRKSNVWMDGVRVLGTRADIAAAAVATGAEVLVVAVAKADAGLLRVLSDAAGVAGLSIKVLPPLEEVLAGRSRLKDLRDISIEDLIGRHPVDTEIDSIAGYLQSKRVLVTGAGGSIGSELCKQIAKFAPSQLILLDHDESGLQSAHIAIVGHGLMQSESIVLASIRDERTIIEQFERHRPEVVFHAAALKHLPVLEQYPAEAWKTNVVGTHNVLKASQAVGVHTFVNISTDKAANPTSVLGHSKRLAEKLTAWVGQETGLPYLSVRFGNVIGSRGSMLPTFAALIDGDRPLTITHPDVTRFFMTVSEACQLVVQAGGIGKPGEVLILDMGEPVRILDVANRMIDMSGKDIAIVYTGLRPGEKLHEELREAGESDSRPVHPKISHTAIEAINPSDLDELEWTTRYANRVSASTPAHENASL